MDSSCHSSPLVKWKIQMILHLNWPFFFFFFRYDEHGSKNRAGGPKQLNLENKSNTQFTRPISRLELGGVHSNTYDRISVINPEGNG